MRFAQNGPFFVPPSPSRFRTVQIKVTLYLPTEDSGHPNLSLIKSPIHPPFFFEMSLAANFFYLDKKLKILTSETL